jgi:penicillin amidase
MRKLRIFVSNYPFLSRAILILVPLVVVIVGIWLYLLKSVAIKDGVIREDGLKEEIIISFSSEGIPHIQAKNEMDAYFALGFVHAQDRIWQMDMYRRLARGELSELLGKESLSSDIHMRVIGLKKIAEQALANLNSWELEILKSYSKGVNSGIKNLKVYPPEYLISSAPLDPWSELDSLIVFQLLAYELSSNYRDELMRGALVGEYGVSKTNELMPAIKIEDESTFIHHKISQAIYERLPQQDNLIRPVIGSNAWVVSGKRTQNGKVLLANDPHLNNSIPSIFFLAHIKGGELDVEGATFPGLPFIAIGRNRDIAWGITASMVDNQDLFIEKINPLNVNQYLIDGIYKDMSLRHESIKIKSDFLLKETKPYEFFVRETINGPIISDALGEQAVAMSFSWTGSKEKGGSLRSFLKMNYARNWQEFNEAFKDHIAPINSIVYGDKEGNIGLLVPGRIPLRGTAGDGSIPREGGTTQRYWQGFLDYEKWLRIYNPDDGYLVTANNNVFPDDYPAYVTSDWLASDRYESISDALAAGVTSLEASKKLQFDVKEPLFELFKVYIKNIAVKQDKSPLIEELLLWDGNMYSDSTTAAKFAILMAMIYQHALADDIKSVDSTSSGKTSLYNIHYQGGSKFIKEFFSGKELSWCDDVLTSEIENCFDLFQIALEKAEIEIDRKVKGVLADKKWGDIHQYHLPHFPYSKVSLRPFLPPAKDSIWSPLFHRNLKGTGGLNSINVGQYDLYVDHKYQQFAGAVYRQVIELGKGGEGFYMLNTGQSGNIFSEHYDDLIQPYLDGLYISMNQKADSRSVTLVPSNRSIK